MQELLERDDLLRQLHAAATRAAAGHGVTVLIEGEAGLGKTSLLHAFAAAIDSHCNVLWGWCEALFTPRPLGPLQDMGRALHPSIAELLDQSASPDRLFPAVLDRLQLAEQATVMIFEDVHWADNATLDLVKFLGRRISLLPAMLVLTTRSDEQGKGHPLTYVMGDLPAGAVTRLKLEPLSPTAVSELARMAGRPIADLHRITAGNPFFVTELLAAGEAHVRRVPDSIRDAVWSRLSRLSADERELLEMISIVPGFVEPGVIRALFGPTADDLLERCLARGLLSRDGAGYVTFRHELARQATLDRLSPSLQRTLHAKAGAALAQIPAGPTMDDLARRVHHALGAGEDDKVLALAPQAAALASQLGAHHQAASFLSMALKFVTQVAPHDAAQLHEDWAKEATMALSDYDAIIAAHRQAIDIWRGLGRIDKVVLNLRGLARLHWRLGQGDEAERLAEQAVDEAGQLPPGPVLATAYSTRSQLHMLHYAFDEAIEWGSRAIDLAEQHGETETRVHALNNVGTAMLFDERPGGRELMEEGLALALAGGFHDHAGRAYTNFAEYALVAKDFVLAERLLEEGIAFAARHDLDTAAQYLLGRQAQFRMDQGRLREAETIAQGVMKMDPLPVVMRLPAQIVLGRVRGRREGADGKELLLQALEAGEPTGELQRIFPARIALVEAGWLAEDLSDARTHLAALAGLRLDHLRSWDQGELAAWWRRCAMPGALPFATAGLPRPWALELEGRPLAAAAEWDRLSLPFEAAMARLQVTDSDALGAALAEAVTALEEIDARAAAALARRLARRRGVAAQLPRGRRGPYAASRQHPLGLTSSEQQVLALIAEGKTNKEVARSLSRSPRTVEHQVSSVLGKFSAANRMEVVLRLRNEPWLLFQAAE